MGSKLGLIFALSGGILYFYMGVTTFVSSSALDTINSLITQAIPGFSSQIIPIVKWLTSLGGAGIILGGLLSYFGSGAIKQYAGYIIILSALGGIIFYGSIIFEAYQAGVFSKSNDIITKFFINLGPGLLGSALSVLAYFKQ